MTKYTHQLKKLYTLQRWKLETKSYSKIKENIIIKKNSGKILKEDYIEKCSVRISIFIKIVYNHQIYFNPLRGYMELIKKENWFGLGKVIKLRRNYCKVKVYENQSEFNILTKDSIWNIEKRALKRSNKFKE